MSDLLSWLKGLGLDRYGEVLQEHDIDLSVVADLTEHDLEQLGLSLGHRRKFLSAAAKLRMLAEPSPPTTTASSPDQSSLASRERRQLTVAFVDLVAATALGTQLDPEDLIQLLRQYRDACLAAVNNYNGYVAQYLGDGILVYFGFPQAQEDAAERAIRASLEIVQNVSRLHQPNGQPLQARVGIATGLVVAGSAGVGPAGEETVVGDTPNLAARLQGAAEPNSVLVAPATHRLTRHFFEFSFFGERLIKGFAEPIAIWKVLRESATDSRFAAAHAAAGPIIGRERELSFMYDSWRRAIHGNGHVMLLVGEAGMGKSRLSEAFADRIQQEPSRILRCQCSPYHGSSALYPVEKLLRQQLNLSRDASDQDHADRIERLVTRFDQNSRTARLLLAELLDIPSADTLSSLEMTPLQRQEETLALLEELLVAPQEGPVLLLIEDAHWSDQTTQALIDRLLKRVGDAKALIMITHRPELKTNWSDHPNATMINCKPIGPAHCQALIRQLIGKQPVGEAIIREITARSDGVPLFAVELTKAVVDWRTSDTRAIPLTLQDTLMARLDGLGSAKEIAQIASVIGRQFSLDSLRAISALDDDNLANALARLRASGLIFVAEGQDQLPIYSFNHSLAQEAAYESLSRERRQIFHRATAEFLASRPGADEDNEPALIAYHYGRAGHPERSIHFWLLASDRSSRRLAFADSIASLRSALTEASRIGDPALRARLSVDAQLKLGITLANYRGPQTAEAGAALEEARRLAEEAKAGPQMFQATWGLYLNAARTHRLDKAKIHSDQLLQISDQVGDDGLKLEALHHRWGYAYFTGQTSEMIEYTTEGLRQYDRDRHHKLSYVFAGHDVAACAHCALAMGLGLAGRAKSARSSISAGLEFTLSLKHPLTLGFYYAVACPTLHFIGDFEGCREYAEELVRVASRYDYPAVGAVGSFMRGSALVQEDASAALKQMEPCYEAALSYGFLGVYPGVIVANALAAAGRSEEALAMIKRLIDSASTPQTGVFVPELWRLRGELTLRRSADEIVEAERCLRIAEGIARQQGALVFHLKASTRLAELLANSGRRDEAGPILEAASSHALDEWTGSEPAAASRLRSELGYI